MTLLILTGTKQFANTQAPSRLITSPTRILITELCIQSNKYRMRRYLGTLFSAFLGRFIFPQIGQATTVKQ